MYLSPIYIPDHFKQSITSEKILGEMGKVSVDRLLTIVSTDATMSTDMKRRYRTKYQMVFRQPITTIDGLAKAVDDHKKKYGVGPRKIYLPKREYIRYVSWLPENFQYAIHKKGNAATFRDIPLLINYL